MSEQRPPGVNRVEKALCELGVPGRVRQLDESARTARQAALALGVHVGQIASSLVFLADGKPIMVVSSGAHRVDEDLLGVACAATISKASADDVRACTGFAIGGVSPVALATPVRMVIDESLREHSQIWAAAGHPHWVFPTHFDELVRATGARPVNVAARGQ